MIELADRFDFPRRIYAASGAVEGVIDNAILNCDDVMRLMQDVISLGILRDKLHGCHARLTSLRRK